MSEKLKKVLLSCFMQRARKITRKPAGNDASVTQQYAHSGMSCGSSEESSPPRRRSYRVDCLSSIGFEIELLGLVADSEHRLCAHAQRLSLADRFQGLLINHNKHRMYFAPVESLCTKSTPIRPHALPNSRSLKLSIARNKESYCQRSLVRSQNRIKMLLSNLCEIVPGLYISAATAAQEYKIRYIPIHVFIKELLYRSDSSTVLKSATSHLEWRREKMTQINVS